MPLFRPRLVVPVEYAGRWRDRAPIEVVSPGRLAFIELVVDEAGVDEVLEEMTAASTDWLRRHPGAPRIEDVARYEREPKGENDYLMLPVSLGLYSEYRPYVDCEDLEIGVSAQARARGQSVRPRKRQVGDRMWHIETEFADGRIQDTTGLLLRRQGEMVPWI